MSVADPWTMGDAYEPFIGRWSRVVARRFIEWLAPAPAARWLDVGCGTGALTETILEVAEPKGVLGVDPSDAFVRFASERIRDQRAEFAAGDGAHLPRDCGRFDYAVSGLVLNFVPDPAAALREMKAVTGGVIGAYVWDYSHGMEMLRFFWDAAKEIDPTAASFDEGFRFPICRPDGLDSLWNQAGLDDVTVTAIDIETPFSDFDDFWSPFLGGQGPAPSYAMSLEEPVRAELRALIRERLPVQSDGTIPLTARAWGVRGQISK